MEIPRNYNRKLIYTWWIFHGYVRLQEGKIWSPIRYKDSPFFRWDEWYFPLAHVKKKGPYEILAHEFTSDDEWDSETPKWQVLYFMNCLAGIITSKKLQCGDPVISGNLLLVVWYKVPFEVDSCNILKNSDNLSGFASGGNATENWRKWQLGSSVPMFHFKDMLQEYLENGATYFIKSATIDPQMLAKLYCRSKLWYDSTCFLIQEDNVPEFIKVQWCNGFLTQLSQIHLKVYLKPFDRSRCFSLSWTTNSCALHGWRIGRTGYFARWKSRTALTWVKLWPAAIPVSMLESFVLGH